jgi:hypothetical protein
MVGGMKVNISTTLLRSLAVACIALALSVGGRIVATVRPEDATTAQLLMVAVSGVILIIAVVSPCIHLVKRRRTAAAAMSRTYLPKLRQATLIALAVVSMLSMRWYGIFSIWDAVPLILAALLLEFYFQAEKRPLATLHS